MGKTHIYFTTFYSIVQNNCHLSDNVSQVYSKIRLKQKITQSMLCLGTEKKKCSFLRTLPSPILLFFCPFFPCKSPTMCPLAEEWDTHQEEQNALACLKPIPQPTQIKGYIAEKHPNSLRCLEVINRAISEK